MRSKDYRILSQTVSHNGIYFEYQIACWKHKSFFLGYFDLDSVKPLARRCLWISCVACNQMLSNTHLRASTSTVGIGTSSRLKLGWRMHTSISRYSTSNISKIDSISCEWRIRINAMRKLRIHPVDWRRPNQDRTKTRPTHSQIFVYLAIAGRLPFVKTWA